MKCMERSLTLKTENTLGLTDEEKLEYHELSKIKVGNVNKGQLSRYLELNKKIINANMKGGSNV
jgi:hypothetical protein